MTDIFPGLRRWHRREYLRQHAERRRAAAKAAGARRIDVTLDEEDLANFERVKQSLERINRIGIERGIFNTPKTLPDGRTITIPATKLSDPSIIKTALQLAAAHLDEEAKRRPPELPAGGKVEPARKKLRAVLPKRITSVRKRGDELVLRAKGLGKGLV